MKKIVVHKRKGNKFSGRTTSKCGMILQNQVYRLSSFWRKVTCEGCLLFKERK